MSNKEKALKLEQCLMKIKEYCKVFGAKVTGNCLEDCAFYNFVKELEKNKIKPEPQPESMIDFIKRTEPIYRRWKQAQRDAFARYWNIHWGKPEIKFDLKPFLKPSDDETIEKCVGAKLCEDSPRLGSCQPMREHIEKYHDGLELTIKCEGCGHWVALVFNVDDKGMKLPHKMCTGCLHKFYLKRNKIES